MNHTRVSNGAKILGEMEAATSKRDRPVLGHISEGEAPLERKQPRRGDQDLKDIDDAEVSALLELGRAGRWRELVSQVHSGHKAGRG